VKKDAFGTPDFGPAHRGKNNNRRGKQWERTIAANIGGERVGQAGGKDDVQHPRFAIQAKVGTMFPERLWKWLAAVPIKPGQRQALVVGDAPGPGKRRRAVVLMNYEDWREAEGLAPTEEEA
jgi:hypothetical protein